MRFVHHDQSVHLREETAVKSERVSRAERHGEPEAHLLSGDAAVQNQVLGAGEVREQRPRFGAQGVLPGEPPLEKGSWVKNGDNLTEGGCFASASLKL